MSLLDDLSGSFNDFSIGDTFDALASVYLKREEIKAGSVAQTAVNDQAQLIGIPANITENVNAQPISPERTAQIVGAAVDVDRVNIMGVEMSKQALYIVAAALAGVVLVKVLR